MPVSTENIVKGQISEFELEQSLGRYLLEHLEKYGSLKSQICSVTGQVITYKQLKEFSIKTAIELGNHGLTSGDVISICSSNNLDITTALLGSIFIGAIVAPLDPILNKHDTKHLLNISKPKLIFCEKGCEKLLSDLRNEHNWDYKIVVFGQTKTNLEFSTFKNNTHIINDFRVFDTKTPDEHLAFIMSSSGTTGLPKGVMLTHANFLVQLQIIKNQPATGLPVLNLSTLYWISGMLLTLGCITVGSIKIVTPPFDPEHILKTIEKYCVRIIVLGVTYYVNLVTNPISNKYDLSCAMLVSVGGSQINEKQKKLGEKLFENAEFLFSFGLTEATGPCFKSEGCPIKCLGTPFDNCEAKIIDFESGKTLGPHKVGELCIKGPIICKGYYNNSKSTNEAFDNNGWFKTGDACFYDENSLFYFEGRIKEQFKCRGWQISPLEMEMLLMKHPDVKEAAVIGIPHEVDVTRGKGFITCRPGAKLSEDDIQLYLKENSSPNKQLFGGIVFVKEMPITPSGKIKKIELYNL